MSMRSDLAFGLVVAMALVETWRGGRDVLGHIRQRKATADSKLTTPEDGAGVGGLLRRHQHRAVLAVVCVLALVPVLFYGSQAMMT